MQIWGQLKRSKISVTSTCLKAEAKASTSFLICKCDEAAQSLKILSKNNRQKKIKQNPMNCFENSYHCSSIKRAKETLLPTLPPTTTTTNPCWWEGHDDSDFWKSVELVKEFLDKKKNNNKKKEFLRLVQEHSGFIEPCSCSFCLQNLLKNRSSTDTVLSKEPASCRFILRLTWEKMKSPVAI